MKLLGLGNVWNIFNRSAVAADSCQWTSWLSYELQKGDMSIKINSMAWHAKVCSDLSV